MTDLSINRDLSKNLIANAQKALNDDGQISAAEYEKLKKAALADGKITENEILFISSLDDENVIKQLKSPTAITSINIINEKDQKLEVEGETINVKKSLNIEKRFIDPVVKENNLNIKRKEVSYEELMKNYSYTVSLMKNIDIVLDSNNPDLTVFNKNFAQAANNLINLSPTVINKFIRREFILSSLNALSEIESKNLSAKVKDLTFDNSFKMPPMDPVDPNLIPGLAHPEVMEFNKLPNDMNIIPGEVTHFDPLKHGTDVIRHKTLQVFASNPAEIIDYFDNTNIDPDGNGKFLELMKTLITPENPENEKELQKYISKIIVNLAEPIRNIGPQEKTIDTENKIIRQARMLGYFLGVTETAYEHKYKDEKAAEEAKTELLKAIIDEAVSKIPLGEVAVKLGKQYGDEIKDLAEKVKEKESEIKGAMKDKSIDFVENIAAQNNLENFDKMKGNISSMKTLYRKYLNIDQNSWLDNFIETKYAATYVNNNKLKQ